MRKSMFCLLLLLLGFLPFAGTPFLVPPARAGEDWREEFQAVCAQTDVSMTLSKEELMGLIQRCEQLKPRIELEEETIRKVFLRRLLTCRDLFVYILESRNKESNSPESIPRSIESSR